MFDVLSEAHRQWNGIRAFVEGRCGSWWGLRRSAWPCRDFESCGGSCRWQEGTDKGIPEEVSNQAFRLIPILPFKAIGCIDLMPLFNSSLVRSNFFLKNCVTSSWPCMVLNGSLRTSHYSFIPIHMPFSVKRRHEVWNSVRLIRFTTSWSSARVLLFFCDWGSFRICIRARSMHLTLLYQKTPIINSSSWSLSTV